MVLLTGLAARPQLAARLHVAALLAPVASVRHMASLPLEVMADFGTDGES